MPKPDYIRQVFHLAINRAIDTFVSTMTQITTEQQELKGTDTNPMSIQSIQMETPISEKPEYLLEPSNIERQRAAKILERMGWKVQIKK